MADKLITVDNLVPPIQPAESITTSLQRLDLTTELGLPPTGFELVLSKNRKSSAQDNPRQEFRLGLEIDQANGGFVSAEFSDGQQVNRNSIANEAVTIFFDPLAQRWIVRPLNRRLQRAGYGKTNFQLSGKPYDFPTGASGEKLPLFAVAVISRTAGEGRIPAVVIYKSDSFAIADPLHHYTTKIEPKFELPPRTDLVGEGRPIASAAARFVQAKPTLSPDANTQKNREPIEDTRRQTVSAALELLQNLGVKIKNVDELFTIMPEGKTIELYLSDRDDFDKLFPSYETCVYHAKLTNPNKSAPRKRRLTKGIIRFTSSRNASRRGEIAIYEIPQLNPSKQIALATGSIETYHYIPDYHVVISASTPSQLLTILQTMASGTRQIK